MSLEQKLGFLNRFKSALASSCAAYSLAVSLALGAAFYGCGKGDEPGEGNQRYACEMGGCVPDSNGPYAVSDCNNECGEGNGNDGGNGQVMDYFRVTENGMSQCDWGWSAVAYIEPMKTIIKIDGSCSNNFYNINFFPLPPPSGGSAPCQVFNSGSDPICNNNIAEKISGSLALTRDSSGAYRVEGNCSCVESVEETDPPEINRQRVAEFSLPLEVR